MSSRSWESGKNEGSPQMLSCCSLSALVLLEACW